MSTKVWLSSLGRPVDPQDATISVFDRGFLYGDSVYETLRTVGGRILEFDRHHDRLLKSAAGIGFEVPFAKAQILDATLQTLAASTEAEARIRIIATRGAGPLSLDVRGAATPQLIVMVQRLEVPAQSVYEKGIAACLVVPAHNRSPLSGLKTGNYVANVLALRQAIEARGDDAIMCNAEGAITEATTSNVFVVTPHGTLVTPALDGGLLSGITRAMVLELANDLGINCEERVIWPEELRQAAEIFLSSSVRGVMPVTLLDGEAVGAGVPGPLTRRLRAAYVEKLARISRGES
jgi:branched-chain amino acid aminotransferase